MGRITTTFDLTDDEQSTILGALKIAILVVEMDLLKASIRYDKDDMSYQESLVSDIEKVMDRFN